MSLPDSFITFKNKLYTDEKLYIKKEHHNSLWHGLYRNCFMPKERLF